MYSMTGFIRSSHTLPEGELTVELRSVNHRYLEFHIRLPESLKALENTCRETIRRFVSRGKIDGILIFVPNESGTQALKINEARVSQWLSAANALNQRLPNPSSLSLDRLMQFPGVLMENEFDAVSIEKGLQKALEGALTTFNEQRAREGAALKDFLLQALSEGEEIISALEQEIPRLQREQRERFDERLKEFASGLDPHRLEQEWLYQLQKSDVTEEIVRLTAHFKEVRLILSQKGAIGRRLDFMMQELHREANTLGSKSTDLRLTQASVDLKVLIEKMREQVQNIE